MMMTVEDRLLHWLRPPASARPDVPAGGETWPMLARHFGAPLWAACVGQTVLDYGCGDGPDAIALAQHGAAHVTGYDVNAGPLLRARARAAAVGVGGRCTFTADAPTEPVDLIVTSDTFEHVWDLGDTLAHMAALLRPGGRVWAAFGPPWYHPRGGHGCAVFPWAHLLFSEAALCRWRSAIGGTPIRDLREVGLNRMSIRRFQRIAAASAFRLESLRLIPIRRFTGLGLERLPLLRELVTSVVTCQLVRR